LKVKKKDIPLIVKMERVVDSCKTDAQKEGAARYVSLGLNAYWGKLTRPRIDIRIFNFVTRLSIMRRKLMGDDYEERMKNIKDQFNANTLKL